MSVEKCSLTPPFTFNAPSRMSFIHEDTTFQFCIPEILSILDFDVANWSRGVMKQEEPLVSCASKAKMLHPRPTSDLKVEPTRKKRATTPRIRNKARIELLRQEIEVLEAELEALQRRKQMTGVLATTLKKSTPDPLWKAIATRQSKERERALRCNEQLREMIAEQQMLTVLLSGVLTEWISNPDQAYL